MAFQVGSMGGFSCWEQSCVTETAVKRAGAWGQGTPVDVVMLKPM